VHQREKNKRDALLSWRLENDGKDAARSQKREEPHAELPSHSGQGSEKISWPGKELREARGGNENLFSRGVLRGAQGKGVSFAGRGKEDPGAESRPSFRERYNYKANGRTSISKGKKKNSSWPNRSTGGSLWRERVVIELFRGIIFPIRKASISPGKEVMGSR